MNKTNANQIQVCDPIIDAFAGTVTVNRAYRKRSTQIVFELYKNGILSDYYENRRGEGGEYKGCQYQHNFKMKGFEDESAAVIIQISPLNKSKKNRQNFIRFEFKGNKLNSADIHKLTRLIRDIACLDYIDSLLKVMKVNRIDFAIDIYGIHITDLLFRGYRFRTSKLVFNKDTGELETVYIGSSRRCACIYNKPAELYKDSEYTVLVWDDMVRIEVRLFPYCKFKDLRKKMKKLFSFIKIYSNDLDPDDFSNEFLEHVRNQGLQEAFVGATDKEKLNLEKYKVSLYSNREMEIKAVKEARSLGLIFKNTHKRRRIIFKKRS